MDRLTFLDNGSPAYRMGDCIHKNEIARKLYAYEDTGLSPNEILELKAEKEKQDKLHEENIALLWNSKFCRCPKCGGEHISVKCKRKRVKSKRTYYSYYFGFCHSCKYKGGLARLPSEVFNAWNKEALSEQKKGGSK